MAVLSRAVSVATTATRIDSSEGGQSSQGLAVHNAGEATVYLGGVDVSTANGYPLAAGEHFSADLAQGDLLYGVVAASTVEVRVFEVAV